MIDRQTMIQRALQAGGSEFEAQLGQMFNFKGGLLELLVKSELPPGLVIAVSKALVLADVTGCKILRDYVKYILRAQISKDRRGRIEMMEAISSIRRGTGEESL